jgi:hypothetical protein
MEALFGYRQYKDQGGCPLLATPQAAAQKEHTDTLTARGLAQDPKLLDAQRKLQQLQDQYAIATKWAGEGWRHVQGDPQSWARMAAMHMHFGTVSDELQANACSPVTPASPICACTSFPLQQAQ